MILDTATDELLRTITERISNVDKKIRAIGNEIERNKIGGNHKANKSLKNNKKKLLRRKIALEKE